MSLFWILSLCFAAVSAVPLNSQERIVGGTVTTINNYPAIAGLLRGMDLVNYIQICGGSILNQRSVLTAAHCFTANNPARYRIRVGSSWRNTDGVVHNLQAIIMHPNYSEITIDSDIAIVRTLSAISYNNVVQPASIAGPNYAVADNQVVWAAGWGATASGAPFSEQLRHVQIWSVNRAICRQQFPFNFNDNMMCAGNPNGGGLSTCQGDSGGPLYHQGVVVGVTSFGGMICGDPNQHAVYALVSRFTPWIQANA